MTFGLRRLGAALLTLVAVSILAFVFVELAPGDFVDQLRLDPRVSADRLETMEARFGLDRPLVERYLLWASGVLDGSWGYSLAYGTPVAPLIGSRLVNTLLLSVAATALAWAVALPLGLYWAGRPRGGARWLDVSTSLSVAVPELVLAVSALAIAERSGVFPVGGMGSLRSEAWSVGARALDFLWHLLLPVAVLAIPAAAVLTRHVRVAVEEVLEERQVSFARASGVSGRAIVWHHLIRPAAAPLLALASLSVASLVSGSFVVEVVMGWPGLGPLLLDAIRARDVHLVIGGILCSAVLVVVGRLVSDTVLYLNDPRVASR